MPFAAFHPVGPDRLRECVGLDFEDFRPGQRFRHAPALTVTQQDNAEEALLTLNQARIHFDDHHARASEFGQPLVVSTLSVQRAIGLGWKTFGRRARLLGFDSIALRAPVHGGDTLAAESRVLETAPLAELPECGAVLVETTLRRTDDSRDVALLVSRQAIWRRGRGPLEGLGYSSGHDGADRHPAYDVDPEGVMVETIGLEFDALRPGLRIEHRPGFAFDAAEAAARARRAGEHAPGVIDPAAAAAMAPDGRAALPETWVLSVVTAATTRAFGLVVANLAWENVTFPEPARDGDVVFAESEILAARSSASRPGQGILHVATTGLTREGRIVVRFERRLLIWRSRREQAGG
jgi:itaconyl-CoA hydratase